MRGLPSSTFSVFLGAVLLVAGLGGSAGCGSGGGNGPDSGSGGRSGSGGATATGGRGGGAATGGATATGGTAGTGGAATGGGSASGGAGGGTAGAAGSEGPGGQGGGGGASTVGPGGGAGGQAGAGGPGGGAGGQAGAGGRGGGAGQIGTGGRGGAAGGRGGAATGGNGGAGGQAGSGAAGGAGGGQASLRLTLAELAPASQLASLGLLVAVDAQDTAVAIGPLATNANQDPGPAISWLPRQGARRRMTFANAVTPKAMAVGPGDALWLTGDLFRPVTFGGPTLPAVENSHYLVKLGADGSHGFSVAVARSASPNLQGITVDGDGNSYVVGAYYVNPPTGGLTSSVMVAKFSPTGGELWNRSFPGTESSAYAADVALAPNGDVVIAGGFAGQVTFGATQLTSQSAMSGGYNGFVAVLDPANGDPRRAFRFGGTVFDLANSVEVSAAGVVRIAGELSGASMVGGVNGSALAGGSPFIAELSLTGVGSWVRVVSGRGAVFGADTNTAGRTFAAGFVDVGDGTVRESVVAAVGSDAVLTIPSQVNIGEGNGATSAAADRHGGVWIGGELRGSATFGTTTLTAPNGEPGNFLLHLEP
jgi:hypothetical protein